MRKSLAIALLIVVTATSAVLAGRYNKILSIGNSAPDWSGIAGTDGKNHSLSDYKDAKVIVEVFTCNHCPVARQYEERLIKLQKEYQDRGVQFVAICVNKGEEDSLAEMKIRSQQSGYNFPYLSDPTQASGRSYGAKKTPEVFVLDANRKIVYMGAIDDKWMSAEEVTKPYLRNAIDAVLAGRAPEVTEVNATGCSIEY